MNTRPRRKILAACISLTCAALATPSAYADSAYGVDASSGNAFNKSYDTLPDPDATPSHHTPTGQLYDVPPAREAAEKGAVSGSVEIGILDSEADNPNAMFRKYKDPAPGVFIKSFGVEADSTDTARFLNISGGGVGRGDQFYSLQFGRYNDWKVKGFYNETTHVFTNAYRNLWNGTGSSYLTLKSLTPGATGAPAAAAANRTVIVAGTNPLLPLGNSFNTTCTQAGIGATFATTCYTMPGITIPLTLAQTDTAAADLAIGQAVLATPNSELSLIRKKGGVRADINLTDNWKVFASFTDEKREGARPFGMVQGGGGGAGNIDIPESIDYNTIDFLAGLNYTDALNSANLTAAVSLFRNNISTLTIENPMFLPAANGIASFPRMVFDLYPDNDYYNIKGEYARELPSLMKGRFTSVVSLSQSKQNDALIPSTPYAGATVNTVVGGAWDTLDSLSQKSANLKVDMRLVDLGLSLKPADALDVKGKLRYYETQTNSNYYACNPLTGQWGRLINSGSGAAMVNTPAINALTLANGGCTAAGLHNVEVLNTDGVGVDVVPSAGNINIRSIPFAYRQLNYTLAADYQINRGNSVNANFERETMERDHRERAETWEDKIKLGYVNRGLENGTLRLSFEDQRRRGTAYSADGYHEFYSSSLGPNPSAAGTNVTSWIHINSLHRKFDLSDRDQNVLNARFNYMLRSDLDLGVSMQLKNIEYPDAQYGLDGRGKQDQNSLNFDLTWQASTKMTVSGFFAYQDGKLRQAGIQQNACAIGSTYYFYSDGSVNTTGTLTAGQTAAGITVVGNSGAVSAANFEALCGTASATSPLYPTSRGWSATQKDKHETLGLGVKFDLSKAFVDLNYTYVRSRTGITYTYNPYALGILTSGGVVAGSTVSDAGQAVTLASIGTGFSDLTLEQNILDASVLVPLTKQSAVRLIGRFEFGKIRDWHYDGVAANPTPTAAGQQVYLDSGPQDYRAHMFGASYQHKF